MDKNSAALVKKLQSELEAYQNLQKSTYQKSPNVYDQP